MNKKLIAELSNAHSAPGYEDEIREIMKKELEKVCDVINVDKLGNLIAKKGDGGKKVMLDAHMDEIGLIIKNIDKEGFIKFTTLGGFSNQTLLNQKAVIHTDKGRVYGVIGSKPPHLMEEEERKKIVKSENMFIDIGAESNRDAGDIGVAVGDFITMDMNFKELGGDFITGKAFDDRLGCYAMIEVMKRIDASDVEVYAVGSVQEEVGLKGARTAAYKINPDYALVLDVTTTGDYPGVKEDKSTNKLGKGAVISLADSSGRGLITHPKVKKILLNTARKENIMCQLEVGEGGTTNATVIHLTREGVPSGVISVPTRYIHSPVEVARLRDIDAVIDLTAKAINRI
ncbi:MAG TPA: M42 family peptidase [Euryarchaeota archaeon]|nr:putative aminopeptidase YsdC [archaeon BMS3Bbin15]HDL16144.1 M42 family peptidase [Euryarchaeota archaeon]